MPPSHEAPGPVRTSDPGAPPRRRSVRRRPRWRDLLLVVPVLAALGLAPVAPIAAAVAAAVLLGMVVLNFVVDPFCRYRRSPFWQPGQGRMHYRIAGALRTDDYDTLLVGSSLSEHMSAAMVERHLGGRCTKVLLHDPSARELGLVLRAAGRARRVRRILFSMDLFVSRGSPGRLGRLCPVLLYGPPVVADLRYLFSSTVLNETWHALRRRWWPDAKTPGHTPPVPPRPSREKALADYAAGSPTRVRVRAEHRAELLEANVARHLLSAVRAMPDVQFWFYFPPYSALAWADNAAKGVLEAALQLRRFVQREAAAIPNLQLFDFQACTEIVTDLDRYMDVVHYTAPVDEWLLHEMVAGRHRATPESLSANEAVLRRLAAEYQNAR